MLHDEPKYRRRIRQQAENQKREAESEKRHRENRDAIDGIVREISAIKSQTQADNYEHDRRWKCERRLQIGEIFALVAAAVVGVIAICVGNLDASRQRHLTEIDQRPWLEVSGIEVSEIKVDQQKTYAEISFNYTIKNLGKSPATRIRQRYETLNSADFAALEGTAAKLEISLTSDHFQRYGMILVPGQQKVIKKVSVGMGVGKESIKEQGLLATLFICLVYDAPGFDEPRVTMNVFRLHSGNIDNTGLTTEFLVPQIWFYDLVAPLKFVRLTRIDQLEKVN
jgi:hypothetical protein